MAFGHRGRHMPDSLGDNDLRVLPWLHRSLALLVVESIESDSCDTLPNNASYILFRPAACGRFLPFIMPILMMDERPLTGKADLPKTAPRSSSIHKKKNLIPSSN